MLPFFLLLPLYTLQDATAVPDAALPTETPKSEDAVVPSTPVAESPGANQSGSQGGSETPTPATKVGSTESLGSSVAPAATPPASPPDANEPMNGTRQASRAGGLLMFYDDGHDKILFIYSSKCVKDKEYEDI